MSAVPDILHQLQEAVALISVITGRHVQLDPLSELTERVVEHLERIYPDEDTHALAKRFVSAMDYGGKIHSAPTHTNLWTERDAVVICYGTAALHRMRRPCDASKGAS